MGRAQDERPCEPQRARRYVRSQVNVSVEFSLQFNRSKLCNPLFATLLILTPFPLRTAAVTVDEDGYVNDLALGGADLGPFNLKDLGAVLSPRLHSLNLQNNPLVAGGMTPQVVAHLSTARKAHGKSAVDLSNCGPLVLEGSVTSGDLDADEDNVSEVTTGPTPDTVGHIDLSEIGSLAGDLSFFLDFVNLREINLSPGLNDQAIAKESHVVGDISAFSNMASLERLDLSHCRRISGDLASLSNCFRLVVVDLWSCEAIQGSLSSLEGLTSLAELTLARCSQIAGDLSSLSGMPLTRLDLRGCKLLTGGLDDVSGSGLLHELNLRSCELVTGDIGSLKSCAGLTKLVLIKCELVEGEMASLLSACPKLSELKVDRCPKVIKTAGHMFLTKVGV